MKRIIILITALFFTLNTCTADSDLSSQARMLYAENSITPAFDIFLSIPEEDRSAVDWLLLGNILHDKQRKDDAVFMYQQAVLKDPKYYRAYYNLGNIYLEDDKPNLAIEQYKKALKLKNDYAYAYYNLGCAYLKLGKIRNAKNAFLNAVDLNNNIADVHYNLAYVYKKLNNQKEAEIYLKFYNQLMENQL